MIYDFVCLNCQNEMQLEQSIKDPLNAPVCDKCGDVTSQRLYSVPINLEW